MLDAGTMPYALWFAALALGCAGLYYRNATQAGEARSPEFSAFQRLFLGVYLTMMMADWMQGPYVYALYAHYGFSKGEIGQLFIMGFGSSMVFGTIVGGFADKYGRRANCLLFVALYSIGCLTKHFNNYWILMFGRLMGGISTSILYSAFETWMVTEHKALSFQEDWMGHTFSQMTFGSGLVAIVAGLVSTFLASNINLVAPFDGSLALLLVGGAIIFRSWRENFGDASHLHTGFDNFGKAWQLLLTNEKVLLLGLIQSCFESAMYIVRAAGSGQGLAHAHGSPCRALPCRAVRAARCPRDDSPAPPRADPAPLALTRPRPARARSPRTPGSSSSCGRPRSRPARARPSRTASSSRASWCAS